MKKILITGGTVFVSRYAAHYFVDKGYEVYVVNRNSRPQVPGAKLIEADRHDLGDKLKDIYFDVVADITHIMRKISQTYVTALVHLVSIS